MKPALTLHSPSKLTVKQLQWNETIPGVWVSACKAKLIKGDAVNQWWLDWGNHRNTFTSIKSAKKWAQDNLLNQPKVNAQ